MSKVYNKEELQLRINDILSYLRNIIEDPEGAGVYFSDKLADIFIDVLTSKGEEGDSGINKKFGMVTLVNNTIQFFANEEEYNIYLEDPIKNRGLLLGKVTLPSNTSTTPGIPNPNIDYVTLNTDQDISGIKNFLSGIKLNNSPIITYDSTTKSWLLEGNLIVTGGGAFRAALGDLDVPTIMDAINTDEVTISKEGGILKVLRAGLDRDELIKILSEEKYATQTWVNDELTKFALKTDLPDTSTLVDLSTYQEILEVKDFNKGLKLNNSPIVTYDSTTKSFLFDGNIVVTGGGVFRATLGDIDVPTIMDAINTDEVTISKEGGILKVLWQNMPIDGTTIKRNANNMLYVDETALNVSGGLNEDQLRYFLTENQYVTRDDIPSISGVTYDAVVMALGYTPLSTAGGSLNGNLWVSGSLFPSNIKYYGSGKMSWYNDESNYYIDCLNGVLKYQAYYGHQFLGGNVTIGGTTALDKLHVYGRGRFMMFKNGNSSSIIPEVTALTISTNEASYSGYNTGIGFNALGDYGSLTYKDHIHAWIGLGGFTTIAEAECYPLVFATNGSTSTSASPIERMRITPDGQVIVMGDTLLGSINLQYSDEINRYGGNLYIQHRNGDGTGHVVMCYNGGNVGIGLAYPSERLSVIATSGWCTSFKNTNAMVNISHADGYGMIITSTMTTTSSGYLFRVWQGSLTGESGTGTAIFDVMANNSIIARANFLVTGGFTARYTSDERLKTNLQPIDAGKMILSLGRVREFEYVDSEIERNSIYKGRHIGLIYQDVKGSALSKMCFEREDGYGSLDYFDTSLKALLVGVAQEHEIRLTEDERDIKTLKEENKALRKEIEYLKQRVAVV